MAADQAQHAATGNDEDQVERVATAINDEYMRRRPEDGSLSGSLAIGLAKAAICAMTPATKD